MSGKVYFTIDDIKEFLSEMGYDWDGQVYLGSISMPLDPKKHFNGMGYQKVRLYSREKKELREVNVAVANTMFEICAPKGFYGYHIAGRTIRDLSGEWMKRLFNKNEDGYIEAVEGYYNNLQKTVKQPNLNFSMRQYVSNQLQVIETALRESVEAGKGKAN